MLWGIWRGAISDGIPMTTSPLNIFEPIIFPTAISGFRLLDAEIVTSTSGSDVPRAIAVNAIISVAIFKIVEIAITESTVYFAPIKIPAELKIIKVISFKIGFFLFVSVCTQVVPLMENIL